MVVSIQLLRALASYMVAFGHMPAELLPGPFSMLRGAIGVDLFFVISGFIMAKSAYGLPQGVSDAKRFFSKRVIRIFPTYIFMTLLIVLAVFLSAGRLPDWEFVFRSLTLVPMNNNQGEFLYPYIPAAWTLSFEMFFYACIAILICAKRYSVGALSLLLGVLVFIGYVIPIENAPLATMTASINIEFLMGVWIFELHRRLDRKSFARLGYICGAIGLTTVLLVKSGIAQGASSIYQGLAIQLNGMTVDRWLIWGVPVALFFIGALLLENRLKENRFARRLSLLGDSSYSLYLSHYFLIQVTASLMALTGPLDLLVLLPILVVMPILFFKYVEQPIIQSLTARLNRPNTMTADLPLVTALSRSR